MQAKINELIAFLNTERPKSAPHEVQTLQRYYRIVTERSAYCFVVKRDFENKTVGAVKAGDLMFPKSWSQPAKHPRGNLFNRDTWDGAFGEWSMACLR
ncbi:MAG: hypothetical protein GY737_14035 [Desulfobacteraceae bacterium]|nr:hypothetical protein [Desulfobacteraceae bacterium]